MPNSKPGPESDPLTPEPQEPDGTPSFDPVAFQRSFEEVGLSGWNAQNAVDKAAQLARQHSEFGRKLSEAEKRAAKFDPLEKAMEDPAFSAHMEQAIASFYEQQGGSPLSARNVVAPLDPSRDVINSVQTEIRSMKIERDLDRLESQGFTFANEAQRDAVQELMMNTNLPADKAYFAALGPLVVKQREEAAIRSTVESIRANNGRFSTVASRTGPAKPSGKPSTEMSRDEKIARTEEILASLRSRSD